MVWDILIAAGIAFTQLVITIYGVHVSVQEKRLRNAAIIGLVGAIGIGLTIWGAIRGGMAQQRLEDDIAALKQGQQTEVRGIEEIKEHPPKVTVNIPPGPGETASARVRLVKMESAHRIVENGQRPLIVPGMMMVINLFFANDGSASADHAKAAGVIYSEPDESKKSEDMAIAQFKKDTKRIRIPTDGTIPTGGESSFWFTARPIPDHVVDEDEMNKLQNGTEVLYLLSFVKWVDPSGSHYLHDCRVLQRPRTDQAPIWHFCQDFSDHR